MYLIVLFYFSKLQIYLALLIHTNIRQHSTRFSEWPHVLVCALELRDVQVLAFFSLKVSALSENGDIF